MDFGKMMSSAMGQGENKPNLGNLGNVGDLIDQVKPQAEEMIAKAVEGQNITKEQVKMASDAITSQIKATLPGVQPSAPTSNPQ